MAEIPHILTENQLEIFKLICKGKSAQEIADKLDKEPGYIRKAKSVIRKKLEREFKKIATSLRLDLDPKIEYQDTVHLGLMFGFDWVHNTRVYLIFTEKEGILVWFEHTCSDKCQPSCKETLEAIKMDRGFSLPFKTGETSNLEHLRLILSKIQEKGE